jgi:hypothetical protein
MKKNRAIFIIVSLGLALRLFRLDHHDLWYDEAIGVFRALLYPFIFISHANMVCPGSQAVRFYFIIRPYVLPLDI